MTILFFMWGFMTVFNDILIPRFKDAFTLDYFHAMLVQFAFFGQLMTERLQFIRLRESTEPQEVADLLEGRMVGQIVNVVSPISKYSLVSVDVANAGGGRNHPFQALGRVRCGDARHE